MLSVVIVTLNEEDKIRDCLESVKWADEIIVVDSFSTDRTVEIAKDYTDKIYQRKFAGFGEQKNYALSKASGEWVLSIDADEIVTCDLQQEVKQTLTQPRACGYYIPRKSYFLGRWIRHTGWWPDYVLRLFRRDSGCFSNRLVHEAVEVNGPTQKLRNHLEHHPYDSLRDLIIKGDAYSTLAAKVLAGQNQDSTGKHGAVLLKSFSHACGRFFRKYFLQAGFLDGKEGFIISVFASYSVFLKYAKLWEIERRTQ